MRDIKISQILDDLNRGLTRTQETPGYNPELGCIMDKYDLSKKELDYLFDHPKLKNKKTKLPVFINIVDDLEDTSSTEDIIAMQEVPNRSGLVAEDFDNPWEEEIKQARAIQEQALSIKD